MEVVIKEVIFQTLMLRYRETIIINVFLKFMKKVEIKVGLFKLKGCWKLIVLVFYQRILSWAVLEGQKVRNRNTDLLKQWWDFLVKLIDLISYLLRFVLALILVKAFTHQRVGAQCNAIVWLIVDVHLNILFFLSIFKEL